jgi:hypothetical protein
MFGFGSGSAIVRDRADKVRVLVAMISANLYTKPAAEFVEIYSRLTRVEQRDSEIFFGVSISASCWYDVQATYPDPVPEWMDDLLGKPELSEPQQPSLAVLGGGDDYGVFITVFRAEGGASIELHVPTGQRPGKDAKAMVTELLKLPGFSAAPSFI